MIPLTRGIAVEIGVGSGFNLPLYGSDVERIYGIDPSLELLRIAGNRGDAATHCILKDVNWKHLLNGGSAQVA